MGYTFPDTFAMVGTCNRTGSYFSLINLNPVIPLISEAKFQKSHQAMGNIWLINISDFIHIYGRQHLKLYSARNR